MARRGPVQAELPFKQRGGKRPGSGPKPKGERPVVSRKARPHLTGKQPVHITMRVLPEIASLRHLHRAARTALILGREQPGFRIIYFSILSNHVHLIIEADSTQRMSRGMQGLAIRMARNVNRAMERKGGRVFSDRYHQRVLKTPRETLAAIHYVINNYRKHMAEAGERVASDFVDRLSSAHYLSGRAKSPFPAAKTWLLAVGYLKSGEIDVFCTPGGSAVRARLQVESPGRRPRRPVDSAGPPSNRTTTSR